MTNEAKTLSLRSNNMGACGACTDAVAHFSAQGFIFFDFHPDYDV
jgi:hypothetical protein